MERWWANIVFLSLTVLVLLGVLYAKCYHPETLFWASVQVFEAWVETPLLLWTTIHVLYISDEIKAMDNVGVAAVVLLAIFVLLNFIAWVIVCSVVRRDPAFQPHRASRGCCFIVHHFGSHGFNFRLLRFHYSRVAADPDFSLPFAHYSRFQKAVLALTLIGALLSLSIVILAAMVIAQRDEHGDELAVAMVAPLVMEALLFIAGMFEICTSLAAKWEPLISSTHKSPGLKYEIESGSPNHHPQRHNSDMYKLNQTEDMRMPEQLVLGITPGGPQTEAAAAVSNQ